MFCQWRGFRYTRREWLIWLVPRPVQRLIGWVYWDLWWGSWLSWRMTTNERTVWLVAVAVMAGGLAGAKAGGSPP